MSVVSAWGTLTSVHPVYPVHNVHNVHLVHNVHTPTDHQPPTQIINHNHPISGKKRHNWFNFTLNKTVFPKRPFSIFTLSAKVAKLLFHPLFLAFFVFSAFFAFSAVIFAFSAVIFAFSAVIFAFSAVIFAFSAVIFFLSPPSKGKNGEIRTMLQIIRFFDF